MIVRFRNNDANPEGPVSEWGFEGVLAALERGDIEDWSRLAAAVRQDPRGDVAETLEQALSVAADEGPSAVALLGKVLRDARYPDQVERVPRVCPVCGVEVPFA